MFIVLFSIFAAVGWTASCNYGIVESLPLMEGYCQNIKSSDGSDYNGVLSCKYDEDEPYGVFTIYDSNDRTCNRGIVSQYRTSDVNCCEHCLVMCRPYHITSDHFDGAKDCNDLGASSAFYDLHLFPTPETQCFVMSTPYVMKYPIGSMKHQLKPDVFRQMIWESNVKCQGEPSYTIDHMNGCHYNRGFNVTTLTLIDTDGF